MGFTKLIFLFAFLPVSIILYLLINRIFHNNKINNILLVILSLTFYFLESKESLFVFMAISIFTYMAGLAVENKKRDKIIIFFPIVCLVAILAFYKYALYVTTVINDLANKALINIGNLIIPIGISFVIFEAISYVVDIYRGDAEAGSFLECLTFLSLFPKLISGPIVLWKDFKPQIRDRRVTIEFVSCGIDRIIIGYAKKVIIADTFGIQIALINNNIASSGVDIPTMWLRALLYFFQLYFDFSGYSDIAIGICNIFGFNIKENFRYPYLSKSISEFWRRWHISLGTWFREYVYIPLGGNQKGNVYLHLLIVFLLTGIWHGSGLTFFVWGLGNAVLLMIERAIRDKNWYKKIPGIAKLLFTNVIIFFFWILFMSSDMEEAGKNYIGLFIPLSKGIVNFTWQYYLSRRISILLIIVLISSLKGIDKIDISIKTVFETKAGGYKRVLFLLLFIIEILFAVNSTYSPFMYFQF